MEITIILASQSPRRKELMKLLGLPYIIRVADTKELIKSTNPVQVTKELSLEKAEAVAKLSSEKDIIVIGADTVVSVDGKILGKPSNPQEAYQMIDLIQGRTHQVVTGVTLLGNIKGEDINHSFAVTTHVEVMPMSREEIDGYIHTQEPYDKAGGYGIQGQFAKFVEVIQGDYNNVVGLPVHQLYLHLNKYLVEE